MQTMGEPGVGALISALGTTERFDADRLVFCEGDRSHDVYACVQGSVKVFVSTPSGREIVVGHKRSGDAFGELSAFDGGAHPASARTVVPSVIAHMSAARWVAHLSREPQLSVTVLRSLAEQLRRANSRLCEQTTDSALVRTGHLLIELASQQSRRGGRTETIELTITQCDIAERIGTVRESVARALAELRRDGVVETGRGFVVVTDLAALTELVAAGSGCASITKQ